MPQDLKYRVLDKEELESLQPEFIQFLASNGIDAPKWQLMVNGQLSEVDQLINQFSNVIFDKILGEVSLLERRSSSELFFYKFKDTEIVMKGLKIDKAGFDLTNSTGNIDINALLTDPEAKVQLISGEKKYQHTREREIFALLQQQCLISKNEALFDQIEDLQGEQSR